MKKHLMNRVAMVCAFAALLFTTAFSAAAQDDKMMKDKMMEHTKPTVAIVRADWCPYCKQLEPTMSKLIEEYKDRIDFVMFDVTDAATTTQSAATAEKLGLTKVFEDNKKNTSAVVVLGPKHNVLFKTSKNYDRDAYVRAFDDAIAKVNPTKS
ncbi:MAG: thioredoxin domain-containing protein [Pyrinomonadaceae bacterium]